MTADEIVTDPFLRTVLVKAEDARKQCLVLLDLLDAHPRSPTSPSPVEIELAISKQQLLLNSYLMQVRNLNRRAIFSTRQTKQASAEARHEIDTLHLQLQNLYYEQRHLRGEIGACEGYE
jgi:THO complex subunit 5